MSKQKTHEPWVMTGSKIRYDIFRFKTILKFENGPWIMDDIPLISLMTTVTSRHWRLLIELLTTLKPHWDHLRLSDLKIELPRSKKSLCNNLCLFQLQDGLLHGWPRIYIEVNLHPSKIVLINIAKSIGGTNYAACKFERSWSHCRSYG